MGGDEMRVDQMGVQENLLTDTPQQQTPTI